MSESVSVNVSATAFSLLLYENIRNNYDQEGFLLGEIITNEKRSITDNDQEVVTIEHVIKINSVLPCPRLGHFYDNAGKVDAAKIEAFLERHHAQQKKQQRNERNNDPAPFVVVAWYKFKRTSAFKLTLREKIVMKQLATHFMPAAPERFSCCLLTLQLGSDLGATHIFSQTFIRYHKSSYGSLPMHIVNLKDPHDAYVAPAKCSPLFAAICKSLKLRPSQSGYATIDNIENALDGHIASLVKRLEASEQEMHELEGRVEALRAQVNAKNASDDDSGEADTSSQTQMAFSSVESSTRSDDEEEATETTPKTPPAEDSPTRRSLRSNKRTPEKGAERSAVVGAGDGGGASGDDGDKDKRNCTLRRIPSRNKN